MVLWGSCGLWHTQGMDQVASLPGGYPAHKREWGAQPGRIPALGCFLLDWVGTWRPQTPHPRRSCSVRVSKKHSRSFYFFLGKMLMGQYDTELLSPRASQGGVVCCPFLTTKNKEERAHDAKAGLPRRPCPGEPGLWSHGTCGPGAVPTPTRSSLTPVLTPWAGLASVALLTQTSASGQAPPHPSSAWEYVSLSSFLS